MVLNKLDFSRHNSKQVPLAASDYLDLPKQTTESIWPHTVLSPGLWLDSSSVRIQKLLWTCNSACSKLNYFCANLFFSVNPRQKYKFSAVPIHFLYNFLARKFVFACFDCTIFSHLLPPPHPPSRLAEISNQVSLIKNCFTFLAILA